MKTNHQEKFKKSIIMEIRDFSPDVHCLPARYVPWSPLVTQRPISTKITVIFVLKLTYPGFGAGDMLCLQCIWSHFDFVLQQMLWAYLMVPNGLGPRT
jgi:hypothetical protein